MTSVTSLTGILPTGMIPVVCIESLRVRDRERVKCGSMGEVMRRLGDRVADLVGLDLVDLEDTCA